MNKVWDENAIRAEFEKLDRVTGLNGASLPICFGNAQCTLGSFTSCKGRPVRFRFSRRFLSDPNYTEEVIVDVIRHEYAHYMDNELYSGSGHGTTWKQCCRQIGALPLRLFSEKRARSCQQVRQKEDALNQAYDDYREGTLIEHPTYGRGRACGVLGSGITRVLLVEFVNAGQKRLGIRWVVENCKRIL